MAVGNRGQGRPEIGEGLDAVDLAGLDQRGVAATGDTAFAVAGEEAFLRLRAMGRIKFSTLLLSISTRPSCRKVWQGRQSGVLSQTFDFLRACDMSALSVSWQEAVGVIVFRGVHYPKSVILHAVFFYLRYAVSYRDLEEIIAERGVKVDHATLNRWVVRFAPLIAAEAQARMRPTANSLRMEVSYSIDAFATAEPFDMGKR